MPASSYLPPPLNQLHQIGPLLRLATQAIQHRSALAALELSAARAHITSMLLMLAGATVLALLGGFAATITLAAYVWESSHRTLILGCATLVYLLIAISLAAAALRRLRAWRPLHETRNQLHQDAECLLQSLPGQSS